MISRISCLFLLGALFLYGCGSKSEEGGGPGGSGRQGGPGGRSGGEGRPGGQGRQGGGPGGEGRGGRGGRGPSGPVSVEAFEVQPQIISERLEVPGTLF